MQMAIRLVFIGLMVLPASGCSWLTQSSARQQRIDDCLARCERDHARPPQASGRALDAPGYGLRDTRSECERACHAQK